MDEIHAFRGEATLGPGYTFGYEPNTRHAVIVFSRQPAESEGDFALAVRRAEENGLLNVSLGEGGRLRPEAIALMPPEFRDAFQSALDQGYGVIVYSEPVA